MNRIWVSIIWLLSVNFAYGNDSLSIKKRRNEIGVDFTQFFKYYLTLGQNVNNQNYYEPYQPAYFITYRLHLNSKTNLRSGIGGTYSENKSPSLYTDNGSKSRDLRQTLDFRIGYESYDNLSKKFQVFYGLDFRLGISQEKIEQQFSNGGYIIGYENKSSYYGFAPLIGLRFFLNKRLSLLTESSWQLNIQENLNGKLYTPVNSNFPSMPNPPKVYSRRIFASFNFPLFLVLAIDI